MVIFTYQLPSSLSFDNYAEVEADIFKQIEGHGYDEIVLDAQGMKYISSAGLRVVLNLKKKFENVSVINTSVAVYDIFEMTGFTQMMYIKKAIKSISIDGCEIIDEGAYILPESLVELVYVLQKAYSTPRKEIEYATPTDNPNNRHCPTVVHTSVFLCPDLACSPSRV